ncbi:MAG: helix-turn-helix transcriptional regulator [Proteobacteria bacterium]|nr:helix-turn-helix transcriptional regulator [Pseudomonadota bacterium]
MSKAQKELKDFELVFKALAHASRRHILTVLMARGGRMTAGEIAERFSCSWPTTTRHLRVLEGAGLLEVTQKGREWIYRLQSEQLKKTASLWLSWFNEESTGEK